MRVFSGSWFPFLFSLLFESQHIKKNRQQFLWMNKWMPIGRNNEKPIWKRNIVHKLICLCVQCICANWNISRTWNAILIIRCLIFSDRSARMLFVLLHVRCASLSRFVEMLLLLFPSSIWFLPFVLSHAFHTLHVHLRTMQTPPDKREIYIQIGMHTCTHTQFQQRWKYC